ncbi:MAG: hypothetical protein GEV08_02325 [Acidimicrobiia bacterium]|nr:hypothetical protein [Acidimicrobiia bacterium]
MSARARIRGEEGSTLVLALVMVVAFGLVSLAAGRYAMANMADTVFTRERTQALAAAAGGARWAISTVEGTPSQCSSAAPTTLGVPPLNGLDAAVTCENAVNDAGRTIKVVSRAGGRVVRAEARIGVGSPTPVAITSWVTGAP